MEGIAAIIVGLVTVISAFTTAAWAIRSWMARLDASLAEVKSSQEEVKPCWRRCLCCCARRSKCRRACRMHCGAWGRACARPRQALPSRPVAASEEEVTAWLQHVLSGQYAHTLAHLDGPALLLQTEASLLRAGVAPQHCAPLLESIRKRVSAT